MLKTRYFITALSLTLCTQAFAQDIFSKGYVVLVGKDTLRCFVETRDSYWNISELRIKKEENSEPLNFALSTISAFQVTAGYEEYVVRNVDIDMKPVNVDRLEEDITKRIERRTLPLKVLVRAKVSLFTFVDENRKNHFFYENAGTMTELNYVKYMRKVTVLEFPEYKQQLKNLFSDCATISSTGASLSRASLTKLFTEYNECIGAPVVRKATEAERMKIVTIPTVGFSTNSMKYDGADNFDPEGASAATYTSASSLTAGVTFELTSVSRPKKLEMCFDLFFHKTSTISGSNLTTAQPSTYYFDFTYLNLNVSAKYVFTRASRAKPYLRGGVGVNYLFQNNTSARIVDLSGSAHNYTPLIDLRKAGPGFLVGVGTIIGRFNAEARYQFNVFAASERAASVKLASLGLLVGYRLRN